MKKSLLLSFILYWIILNASSQVSDSEIQILQKLDSIRKSASVSKYFAEIYFNTTGRAITYLIDKPSPEKEFIRRMEKRFASYFFRAVDANFKDEKMPEEWNSYYSDTSLSPLKLSLLGINAHINGDIWQTLVTEFSVNELKKYRYSYLKFNKELAKEYNNFYDQWYNSQPRIRVLHMLSIGMSKFYGRTLLKKWRKRQYRIALLHYQNPEKFKVLEQKVQLKRKRINQLILHQL